MQQAPVRTGLGWWVAGTEAPGFGPTELSAATQRLRETTFVVQDPATGQVGVAFGGHAVTEPNGSPAWPLLAALPPTYPEWLGDRSFAEVHGTRFPYATGAMANGIATTDIVVAIGRAGGLGFFGSAGLAPRRVEEAIDRMQSALGPGDGSGPPWGCNLIHSPNEPELEAAVADLYLRRGVRRVDAAAFMNLTPTVVRYSATGLALAADGSLERRNHLFAKVSRPEVARRFMEPAPADILDHLVSQGLLTPDEARIAATVPVAEDYTVEADSGGHTDNRPLPSLVPTIQVLRDRITAERGYTRPIRVGAAGGLGTPNAVAAAFAMGASYVLTGSVNQACVESGLHENGRRLLAQAELADVIMAPAADMFELGVEVQVLRRGSMFGPRAKRLYEVYRSYDSLEAIPADERARIEKEMLHSTFEDAWASTRSFWSERDPREVERAEREPKHKMALVFRSYLGLASHWAIAGDAQRRMDYQIWCGPAMGAFNAWSAGSFLAEPTNRSVVQVALNMMEGAAAVTRAQQLRSFGAPMPAAAFDFRPRPLT